MKLEGPTHPPIYIFAVNLGYQHRTISPLTTEGIIPSGLNVLARSVHGVKVKVRRQKEDLQILQQL